MARMSTQLAAAPLLPPLALVLLLAAGILVHRRRPRLAMSLILLSTVALYTLSTPWVGGLLLKTLEVSAPVDAAALARVDALVVLGGGRRIDAAEYGGDTLNATSLARLRYAARLHRRHGLPIVAVGGKPDGGSIGEGRLMERILRDEYGLPTLGVDEASRTTWENARLAAPLLERAGIRRIALVTHAWHLRRAVPLFEAQGFAVVPAGVEFSSARVDTVFDLLPSPAGLRDSTFALHEWLGILWYKLRSRFSEGKA